MATTTQKTTTGINQNLVDVAQTDIASVYAKLKAAGVPQQQVAALTPDQLAALSKMSSNDILKGYEQIASGQAGNLATGAQTMQGALSGVSQGAQTIGGANKLIQRGTTQADQSGVTTLQAKNAVTGAQGAINKGANSLDKASATINNPNGAINQGVNQLQKTTGNTNNQYVANEAGVLMNAAPTQQQVDAINQTAAANQRNLTDSVNRNLQENKLPSLYRGAVGTGNLGSSRSAIAEGIAQRGATEELSRGQQNIMANAANQEAAARTNAFNQGVNSAQQNVGSQISSGTALTSAGTAQNNAALNLASGYNQNAQIQQGQGAALAGIAGQQNQNAGTYGALSGHTVNTGQAQTSNAATQANIGQGLAGVGQQAIQTGSALNQQGVSNQLTAGNVRQAQTQNEQNAGYNNDLATRLKGVSDTNEYLAMLNQLRGTTDTTTSASSNPGSLHTQDYLTLGAGVLGSYLSGR